MQQLQENEFSLKDEQVLEIIEKYVDKKETNYAILLDGEWGSGKTYFIREKVVPKLKANYEKAKKEKNKDDNLKNKKPIYISLYGIEDVKEISKSFVGEFDQLPPKYSAKKVNGKNAYELARKGEEFELKTRHVIIYSCDVLYQIEKNTFMFEIKCSAGTYIRSICRDIAYKLSTYGTMLGIIRTICGDYSLDDSCTLEQIRENNFKFFEK